MASVEGQRSFYAAALAALRFVEARRPTKRRFGPIGAADKLVVVGPSAIAGAIDAFSRGTDFDWNDQVFVVATSPAHRQLAILGAALVNASKATRLVNTDGASTQVLRGARLVASADAPAGDRSTAERVTQG